MTKRLGSEKEYWVKVYKTGSFEVDTIGHRIEEFQSNTGDCFGVYIDGECVTAIPEREKVTIPKFVAEWIEGLRDKALNLFDAYQLPFGDRRVTKWFMDYSNFDLFARAWLDGYEVEKEPLGVLLVDMPENKLKKYNFLYRSGTGKFTVKCSNNIATVGEIAHKVTEAEAKEKYPNFKWVSLEELENDL